MSADINDLAKIVLSATRKGLFKNKPIFKAHAQVLPDEFELLEGELGVVSQEVVHPRPWKMRVLTPTHRHGNSSDEQP